MADGYDRFDNRTRGGGGGSFVMGLLTGTVLGAGLGMLFAPKAGSELRNQLSEQAGNLANHGVGRLPPRQRGGGRLGGKGPRRCTTRRSEAVVDEAPTKRSGTSRSDGDERPRGSSSTFGGSSSDVRRRQPVPAAARRLRPGSRRS